MTEAPLRMMPMYTPRLRVREISYRDLARLLGISEPTGKRDLARGNFSLQRLDEICEVLAVDIAELVQPLDSAPLTQLSARQALVGDPRALVVTYLLGNDWEFDEIVSIFKLDENQLINILLRLDKLGIVDFQPPKRMRGLTARNFDWRKDGALQAMLRLRASIRRLAAEFEQLNHKDACLGVLRVLEAQTMIHRSSIGQYCGERGMFMSGPPTKPG